MKAADGDTFVAQTVEGVDMTFKIISEEEKSVQVGTGTKNTPAIADSIEGDLSVPSNVEWNDTVYSVSSIGDYAFYNCKKVSNVNLPCSISIIGSNAYNGCENLTHYIVPDSVKIIKSSAFQNCRNLESIFIPNEIESIENSTFNWCSSLKSISLPENLRFLGGNAFYHCSSLTKIILPATLEYIDGAAFRFCMSLGDVISRIESPFSLNETVFSNISRSITLHVPEGTKEQYIEQGWNTDIFKGGIVYGDETPGIGDFFTVTSEKGIEITYKVLDVDNFMVQVGSGLRNTPAISNSLEGIISVPSTVKFKENLYYIQVIGDYAFYNSNAKELVIPEGVSEIGIFAFSGSSGIQHLVLPQSVEKIGESAFQSCTGLKSINIPTNVNVLSKSLFSFCSKLESVTFPDSLKVIGDNAFYHCDSLSKITLPTTLDSIGNNAFYFCSSLTKVIARMNPPIKFGNNAFYRNHALCGLHVPEGTKDDYIAAGWTKEIFRGGVVEGDDTPTKGYPFTITTAEEVEVTICVWDVDEMTAQVGTGFYPNTTIDSKTTGKITIPENVEFNGETYKVVRVGSYAFAEYEGITEVVLPETIWEFSNYAFYGCTSLKSINLPDSLESLSYASLYNCISLKELTLPAKLNYIEEYAIGNCTSLKNVYANMMVPPTLPENAFYNLNSKCVLHVPEGTIDAYHEAGWTEGEGGIFFKIVEGDDVPAEGTEFKVNTVEGVELTLMITSMDNLTCQVGSGEKNDPCIDGNYRGTVTIPATAEYNGHTFTVTSLGDRAFRYTKVDSVYVPETVGTVVQYAFANCDNLSYVSLPDSIKSLPMAAFYKCPNLKEIELPDSLQDIGGYAFSGTGLETVTIPAGVTSIQRNAFSACPNLKFVFAEMPEPVTFGVSAFDGIDPECVLIVPAGTKAAYIEAGWNQEVFGGLVYESLAEYRHDVNKDGGVDINDVVAVINHMAGTTDFPKSDTNGDDATDINDVVSIINFMAGN